MFSIVISVSSIYISKQQTYNLIYLALRISTRVELFLYAVLDEHIRLCFKCLFGTNI